MKFFILGCNGMAGHIISLYLKEQSHHVVGFARSKSVFVDTVVGDAFNTDLIKKNITEGNYDAVVNCIGMLNQFAENDKAAAAFLNGYFPHFLMKATEGTNTQVIHMSTDCVFSGKTGPYTELSFPDGETFYDRSKALGEISDSKNLTLRNSIVGPDIKQKGIGLLNWFMQQKGEVNGFTCAMWTGLTTLQLAKTIEISTRERVSGLINMVPVTNISKYELLRLFNHYLRNDELTIHPVEGIVADKTLMRTNINFDYLIPDYSIMVREMAEWMQVHKKLYPHYDL